MHAVMLELDLLFRITGAVILVMVGLLVLRDAGRKRGGILFFAFAIGVSAYLIGNSETPGFIVPTQLEPFRAVLSGNVAFVYWWFCRSLFEDDFRLGRLELGVAAIWVGVFLTNIFWAGAPINLSWVLVGLGLGLVFHVSWGLLSDRSGDLVRGRRQARLVFAAVPTAFLLLDLVVDIGFGFSWKPLWFTLWQNGALMVLAGVMAYWLLGLEGNLFAGARMPKPVFAPDKTAQDDELRARLLAMMEDAKPYLEPALKFEDFAKQLGVNQVKLRVLINQELGYRHFRNFLNAWRIKAAKQMLIDPARAGDKIIAIAFDAGFASLASFNRAFQVHQNQSPSAYREAAHCSGKSEN